ncbi:MAG: tRNA (adenosine(37)-N6)-threonylcarbamoyltransferase complex transferase subunit TsaD [Candidatus Paceibacteria bacterium]
MRILAIETSCDETAVSIIEATGEFPTATYEILGNALVSQIDIHKEFGGVFPQVAKREHAKALVPMLELALSEAELLEGGLASLKNGDEGKVREVLAREDGLAGSLLSWLEKYDLPEINLITVTTGPGLEPALWVGLSFAKALAIITGAHIVPTNHMEGHILASIYNVETDDALAPIQFPALALLISGGHTELVLMPNWGIYEKIGQTRDDAVGEAFDKVARMLGLPYPGGPEIGKLAKLAREQNLPPYKEPLPRPMMHSRDLDFSFSGLKTAVLYAIDGAELSPTDISALARDFEDAVTEVIVKKCHIAAETHGIRSLIVGGGVSANPFIRHALTTHFLTHFPDCEVYFPNPGLSTDNSIMIALAGHAHAPTASNPSAATYLKADGNRSL